MDKESNPSLNGLCVQLTTQRQTKAVYTAKAKACTTKRLFDIIQYRWLFWCLLCGISAGEYDHGAAAKQEEERRALPSLNGGSDRSLLSVHERARNIKAGRREIRERKKRRENIRKT